jgi:hypothetical protein
MSLRPAQALVPPPTAGLRKLGFESGLGLHLERPQLLAHAPLHAVSDLRVAPLLYLRGELGTELFRHAEEILDLLAATFREPHGPRQLFVGQFVVKPDDQLPPLFLVVVVHLPIQRSPPHETPVEPGEMLPDLHDRRSTSPDPCPLDLYYL